MVAQAQLLDAAKGDKADVFQGALQTRDQAVEALRQYVTESASAVGAVQDLERFMETNDDGAVYALLGQEKASALASALNTTVEAIPTKMRAAIARTNTAMRNLRECLRMEKQLANELGIDEVIRSAVATFENAKLEVTKDNALAKLHSDVEKAQKELSQVTAKLEPFSTFLDRFTGAKSDICRLQQEHDELEARRLSLERRRITLQADAEWKEVTGVAAEEIAQDREVVQQLREQLQVVKTKQSEINAALETLATVRPEMNWKGPVTAVPSTKVPATSAQDKELLQRLVAALSRGRGDFAGENNGKPYIVLTR
jgi:myosin heavy subunit